MHAIVVRLTAAIATASLRTRTAVSGESTYCLAAMLARGTAVLDASATGKHPRARLAASWTLMLSKTERSQNRAREPSKDELQCARSRHGCGKSTANLIIKFRHVSP